MRHTFILVALAASSTVLAKTAFGGDGGGMNPVRDYFKAEAHSAVPAMTCGRTSDNIRTVNSSTLFSHTFWVEDSDTWRFYYTDALNQVQYDDLEVGQAGFMSYVPTVTSGTPQAVVGQTDVTTSRRSFDYAITTRSETSDVTYIDVFVPKDTTTVAGMEDPAGTNQIVFYVTVKKA